MVSKHLSEATAFARDVSGAATCRQCQATFLYEKESGGDIWEEPKFCPECGRRNVA